MLGCKRVVLVALVAFVLSAVPAIQAADDKDCEGGYIFACMAAVLLLSQSLIGFPFVGGVCAASLCEGGR